MYDVTMTSLNMKYHSKLWRMLSYPVQKQFHGRLVESLQEQHYKYKQITYDRYIQL